MPDGASDSEKVVDVAVGVLVREASNGPQVLIARRPPDALLGGFWELPGGKAEDGEAIDACVVREFKEELGISVRVGEALPTVSWQYPYAFVRLHPFFCSHLEGTPQNLEVAEHRWVAPHELGDFEFPPANTELIREVVALLEGEMDSLCDGDGVSS